MNAGSHSEHHSSHKTHNDSQSSHQTYSTALPTGAGFASTQGLQQPQQLQQPVAGTGLGQNGLSNAAGTGGYVGNNPGSGYSGAAPGVQTGNYAEPGYGNQIEPQTFTHGQGGVGGVPSQNINAAGGVSSPPVQNTGAGLTTRAGTDVAGKHPNPTHVSNQYRPGTTYNTAPVAADGAQLHGPPPPAYKEGVNSSVNLPEINPRRP